MKKMNISDIEIRNFKGIGSHFQAGIKENVSIYGDNGTGKTSIYDAVTWLLFDKDSLGNSKFEIQPIDHEKGLETSVAVSFSGKSIVTLGKTYKDKWTKKRGSLEKSLTGHTTEYFIDDVPVKMREYKEKVSELAADEKLFRLLTSPLYFSEQLHWQERREILFDICGDVSDQDVINSNDDLEKLPDILDGHSCDDMRKIIKAAKAKVNSNILDIPGRIDEVIRGRAENAGGDIIMLSKGVSSLQLDLDQTLEELAAGTSDARQDAIKQEISIVIGSMLEGEKKHTKTNLFLSDKIKSEVVHISNDLSKLQEKKLDDCGTLDSLERKATALELSLKGLRENWNDIHEMEYSQKDTCPTCKQSLPDHMKADALMMFNKHKSDLITENNDLGAESALNLEGVKKDIIKIEKQIEETSPQIVEKETELAARKAEINSLPDFKDTPEHDQLIRKQEQLEGQLTELASDTGRDKATLQLAEKVDGLKGEIKEAQGLILIIENDQKAVDRIEELKEKEKKLSREFEKLERNLFLIELFIKTKVSMLEESINSNFTMTTFKLFDTQVNGGISETCIVMVDGVPYGSLNNGARIQSGLDIINTLSRYHDFFPFCFLDNREGVTSIPETESQIINLFVSEKDKTLRVEA